MVDRKRAMEEAIHSGEMEGHTSPRNSARTPTNMCRVIFPLRS